MDFAVYRDLADYLYMVDYLDLPLYLVAVFLFYFRVSDRRAAGTVFCPQTYPFRENWDSYF